MVKKRVILDGKSKKNAFRMTGKIHQAGGRSNYKSPSPTANKILTPKMTSMLCGCLTWKHERNTDECFPIAEQELAEIYGFTDAVSTRHLISFFRGADFF